MKWSTDISDIFLNTSRVLLADRTLFAQVAASMAKVACAELTCTFALASEAGRPFLYYQPDRLRYWSKDIAFLADALQEELLHLLLQHPIQQAKYPQEWAFLLAADLEVLQYLAAEAQASRYSLLVNRLQLPKPWQLDLLYDRLLQLEQANGRDQLYSWQGASPLTYAAHAYWQQEWQEYDQNLWQSWLKEQSDLLTSLFPSNALLRQLNPISADIPGQNWQLVLQRFAHNGTRTTLRTSHRRPSKRYGTFPGTRRSRQQRLVVIIDTSGSIDQGLLTAFFRQLQYLHRQEIKITVVEADHQVRNTYSWNGQPPSSAFGGGHTDFNPALDYANTSGPYDGVVYFTDGKARMPSVVPEWPLLWIISTELEGKDWSDWPGRVIQIGKRYSLPMQDL